LDEQTRESSGDIEGWRYGGKASEQGVGGHRNEPEEEPKDEELTCSPLEVDEEVKNDTEY
jgi:hypothetical protein